jgi:hypothetical protein
MMEVGKRSSRKRDVNGRREKGRGKENGREGREGMGRKNWKKTRETGGKELTMML